MHFQLSFSVQQLAAINCNILCTTEQNLTGKHIAFILLKLDWRQNIYIAVSQHVLPTVFFYVPTSPLTESYTTPHSDVSPWRLDFDFLCPAEGKHQCFCISHGWIAAWLFHLNKRKQSISTQMLCISCQGTWLHEAFGKSPAAIWCQYLTLTGLLWVCLQQEIAKFLMKSCLCE